MSELPPNSLSMSLAEVAAIFRRTPDTFRELRPRLEAAGFPRKLPGTHLWSRPAVEAWFASDAGRGRAGRGRAGGGAAPDTGSDAGPDPERDALALAARLLDDRYAGR